MAKGIIGKKLGMTQIFEADGKFIPVTVVLAGPCTVIQNKTEETDGYNAIQVGFGEVSEKKVTKPEKGHFDKAGVAPAEFVKELRLDAPSDLKPGDVIKADVFALHNFGRGPMKHGSKSHREPGSMGPMHSGPGGRVIKGKKLPGRMGGKSATVQSLTIARVDTERNLILVHGSIPGANGTCVVITEAVKGK